MTDISDAYESAYTILLNPNRTWIHHRAFFFTPSSSYLSPEEEYVLQTP